MTEKNTAFLDLVPGYQPREIVASLERGFACLGLGGTLRPGDRVLLKPNLVVPRSPEKAVTTHPEIVRGVAKLLKDCGARLFIGDSPGFGTLERCLEKGGLNPVLREMDITPVSFDRARTIHDPDNLVGKRLELAEAAFEYDQVVNLAKLKTHGMMGSTLAVKNLFGFVVGFNKAAWHFRAGHDRRLFARIMLDIYRQVQPAWNLVDGIVAMEGEGPTHGQARKCNLLALGRKAPVLDYLVEEWAGFKQMTPLSTESRKLGLLDPETARALGPAVAQPLKPPLKPARAAQAATFPGHRIWHRLLVRRPRVSSSRCHRCGVCIQHCPAKAMQLLREKVVIDYRKCISCYCCQELCPYGAVQVKHAFNLF